MDPADVLAIDLPWGLTPGRTAIASRSLAGIAVHAVVDDAALVQHVDAHAAPRALVLLDVPVEGCRGLSATRAQRAVDGRLAGAGIPILPSVKAGQRGPRLRRRLLELRPDLRILEIYPYAVLRTLWASRLGGSPFTFDSDAALVDLSGVWSTWPPKYKRAPALADRRREVRRVATAIAAVPGFAGAVRTIARATRTQLDQLCDEYDALLGLIAGIAEADGSSWSWLARTAGDAGAILTIADGSLRRRFAAARRG